MTIRFILLIVYIILLFFGNSPACCVANNKLSLEQTQRLVTWRYFDDLIQMAQVRQVETVKELRWIVQERLEILSTDCNITTAELQETSKQLQEQLTSQIMHKQQHSGRTGYSWSIWSYFTLYYAFWLIGLCMLLIGAVGFIIFLACVLSEESICILLWLVAWICVGLGVYWRDESMFPLCLSTVGAIVTVPSLILSISLDKIRKPVDVDRVVSICCAFWTVLFGILTIVHESRILGALTMLPLINWLSFRTVISYPFLSLIGHFYSHARGSAIAPPMTSSLFLLVIHSLVRVNQFDIRYFDYFEPGLCIVAGLVFYLGWLVLGNLHMVPQPVLYIRRNGFAFTSCIASIIIGAIFPELQYLQKLGGSTAILLIYEKYIEFACVYMNDVLIFLLGFACLSTTIVWSTSFYPAWFFVRLL